MLTRWAIALQKIDFTVKHVAGKLKVVPDALSRLFGEVEEEPFRQEPALASICRNVPSDRPHHAPGPRDLQVSSQNLEDVDLVQNDSELYASAVFIRCLTQNNYWKNQRAEIGPYIEHVKAPVTVPRPRWRNQEQHESLFFEREAILFRSYLPGYMRKRSSFRYQLVVPTALRKLVVHSCHDLPVSGGHLAFKAAFDKIRDRYWWPTMSKDVAKHITCCSSCQHRRTSHRPPKLPVGHRPVSRPFQCVAIDLVEYKSSSNNSKYVMSVMDHLTRFLVLVAISDKSAAAIARVLVERVPSVFSVPETLHSDLGSEFENELVKELQSVFGFKKTHTSAYHPQSISLLERVHSTMHNMLAMYANVKYDNWAELLPFI